jgi:hypothetical protein
VAQNILHGDDESPDEAIQTVFEFVWKGIGTK